MAVQTGPLQIRRLTSTQLSTAVLADGEPVRNTTTKELVIGDGVTVGGINPALSSPNLNALSSLSGAADRGFYFTGTNTMSLYTLSALGRTLSGIANSADARTQLGVGTAGTVRFSATKTVAQAIPASTFTLVTLPTAAINVGAAYNTGTSRFVAPVAGDYLMSFQTTVVNTAATDVVTALLYVNGVRHTSGPSNQSGVVGSTIASGATAMVSLAANDFVELFVVSANALNTSAATGLSFLNGTLLS